MTAKVQDVDRGYRALMQRLQAAAKGKAVTVGIHDGEGGAPEPGGDWTVADVASAAEYGLGQPERSWLRGWCDENDALVQDTMLRLGISIVRGQNDVDSALDKAGLFFVASMQSRIRGGIAPGNAPSTIRQKGSSTPLIATGQFVSSITHKVAA